MNVRVSSRGSGRKLPIALYDAGYQKVREDERCLWPFYQIVVCYQGKGNIRIGGERHELAPGTAIFLPPGTEHEYEAGTEPYYLSWVSFLGPIAESLPSYYGLAEPLRPLVLRDAHHPDLHLQIMSVMEYVDLSDSAERISVLLYGVYTSFLLRFSPGRDSIEPETPPAPANRKIDEAVQWMRGHLHEPADVSRLAGTLDISRQHLNRLFQMRYGTTTKDFYLKLKILQAQKDLVHFPEADVKAVAEALGFVNASHFSRVFRHVTGVSPTRFRAADSGARGRDEAGSAADFRIETSQ
ncbi:AraC family transcriptional regulator [Paenibacillus cymbidii]|uniref:AraC family transcriptional regulator n=1 Tax=Paenibacillus cymbidii TaxID=1639034 RepID=UPI00108141FE|nr:AraC family transcriptional regulator [Paenibacillus cymbidii]